MSGYSPEVLEDIYRGQPSDTLLLDRTHLEAMLSGLLSPSDLFTELVDRASYRGDVYVAFKELIVPHDDALLPVLEPGGPARRPYLAKDDAPGVRVEAVLHGTSAWHTTIYGFGIDRDGRLLLTTTDGVARFELPTGATDWAVPIPRCRGNALVLPDGSILILNGTTVLRWHKNEVQIVAGGFTGSSSLLCGPDEQVWVFDCKNPVSIDRDRSITLTRLGSELGQEERYVLDARAGTRDAVWLSGRCFFLTGNLLSGIVDLDQTSVAIDNRVRSPGSHPRGAIRIDERTVLATSRPGTLHRIDLESGQQTQIAKLDALVETCELAAVSSDQAYILVYSPPGRGNHRPTVLALSGYTP